MNFIFKIWQLNQTFKLKIFFHVYIPINIARLRKYLFSAKHCHFFLEPLKINFEKSCLLFKSWMQLAWFSIYEPSILQFLSFKLSFALIEVAQSLYILLQKYSVIFAMNMYWTLLLDIFKSWIFFIFSAEITVLLFFTQLWS